MLVLSRRTNESIHIGDDIIITILGVEGEKIKIGISAPREVTILREEVYEAVQSQDKLKALLTEGLEPETFKGLRDLLTEALTPETVSPHVAVEETPAQKE